MSLSQPPRASIFFFSSSVSHFSASFFSHAAGISVRTASGMDSTPLKYSAKARSKRSKYASSFTSVRRESV
jgi:hypothetical protein